jgi:transcription initiation factor TFIIB
MDEKSLSKLRCPECGANKFVLDESSGEIVCSNCGLVLQQELVDERPEWRSSEPGEKPRSRVGPPSKLSSAEKGLPTPIVVTRDAHGRRLEPSVAKQMMQLRYRQMRTQPDKTRNLRKALADLNRLADRLNLPEAVREHAALVYRQALDGNLVAGRSIPGMVAATVYAACRRFRIPRSLKEIAEEAARAPKEVARDYRLLLRELNLEVPVVDPIRRVSRIASRANVTPATEALALRILQQAIRAKHSTGKDPRGLAAAALYLAAQRNGEHVTQRQLAEVAGVTEVTIRNRSQGLKKFAGQA